MNRRSDLYCIEVLPAAFGTVFSSFRASPAFSSLRWEKVLMFALVKIQHFLFAFHKLCPQSGWVVGETM
jgi:hypothetical protein